MSGSDQSASEEKTRLAEERTEYAEDRTDWAEDRTALANERTFAAWMRTGLASAALGLGFHALVRQYEPSWAAKVGATLFLITGIGIIIAARRSAATFDEKLELRTGDRVSGRTKTAIAAALSLACLSVILILWTID